MAFTQWFDYADYFGLAIQYIVEKSVLQTALTLVMILIWKKRVKERCGTNPHPGLRWFIWKLKL